MNSNPGIVFIHGAGLNSSIWDELRTEIDVPTLAIDFPNRKAGEKANNNLTFEDYVSTVVAQIKNWNMDNL